MAERVYFFLRSFSEAEFAGPFLSPHPFEVVPVVNASNSVEGWRRGRER